MENLVITGLGAVTPIGIGVEEYWQGILDQKCGINRITRFQDENVPITIAGEVKGFDPKNYMPGKLAKETGTFIQYAYASAKEAIEQSGIEIEPEADRIGIVMATALSGTSIIADTERAYSVDGKKSQPAFSAEDPGKSRSSTDRYFIRDPRSQLYREHSMLFRWRCHLRCSDAAQLRRSRRDAGGQRRKRSLPDHHVHSGTGEGTF